MTTYNRRRFLLTATALAEVAVLGASRYFGRPSVAEETVAAASAGPVPIVPVLANGQLQPAAMLPKVVKTEAEWRAQLTPESFEVTREAGTEAPYSGEYAELHDKGVFRCICCDTALFSSDTKFESGTGWPSFWQPIAKENVRVDKDTSFGMVRDAVSCSLCDAHLGHVFNDGPQPTGLLYCMNLVSLHFVPLA